MPANDRRDLIRRVKFNRFSLYLVQILWTLYRCTFYVLSIITKKLSCLSICLSVYMKRLGSYWADFYEIWYFPKTVRKNQVSLRSDKNNGYFTWIPTYIFIISRSVLPIMKNVSEKIWIENQNTYFIFNIFFFFENLAIYEIMWKYVTDPNRP